MGNNQKQSLHSVELVKMKLSFLFLKSVFVEGWDGPWDGINAMTDNVLQSNDLMELNRDPKLTFILLTIYYIIYKPYKICCIFDRL